MSQSSDFDPALHDVRKEEEADAETSKPAGRKARTETTKPAGRGDPGTETSKPAGRGERL